MIKAGRKQQRARLSLEDSDIERVAKYLTRAGNTEQTRLGERLRALEADIRDYGESIERRHQDIEQLQNRTREAERETEEVRQRMKAVPASRTITGPEARTDIERALALPFVKSISRKDIDGHSYIVATTRENSLYTTLERKYSRSERWYKAKPYKIALPAYHIRIGLTPYHTCANDKHALGIALADREDTAHFLEWIRSYQQETRAHWGTRTASVGAYEGICLGEYEGEVSSACRRSIADGLTALAVYLQTAGTESAYVHGRHLWALWLGKDEYNRAIVPSEAEVKNLVEDETAEDGCDCYDSEGDRQCSDECECECHN